MIPSNVQILLTDFRHDLESFYQRLHLAPPYDSVEKALSSLSTLIQTKTADEQQHIADNSISKWKLYQKAMIESGLYKKHRGIIAGLLRSCRGGGAEPNRAMPRPCSVYPGIAQEHF